MPGYYADRLAGERLRDCYALAPPRVRAYLEAEIAFVLERITPEMQVLELGCGYGRVLRPLVAAARSVTGIDTSEPSLRLAREHVGPAPGLRLAAMDAAGLAFRDRSFDLTACIQNGISAFAVDQERLLAEAVRVTRAGGRVLFSSYAERFWEDRLAWFEAQAAHGLIGPIDREATGDGVIVCRDGFRATTVDAARFTLLAARLGLVPRVQEVAGASLFCELVVP
ncbi:MAG TPA: class I SAM-dependent methyltransferase [Candidatus Saccharimonadales bacterium]|nr:class I SAM-dependent methyltransferase [Candidatus Saccharimonadales bacterium]